MSERLVARELSKRFGATVALDRVSAEFAPGEIHAVLGENGAGKSTLMNALAGFVVPDSGTASLGERALPLGRPHACREAGIEMVHQHFTLVPEFTVAENLALARVPRLACVVDARALAERALALGRGLGWEVDPHSRVRGLPVGAQQRIEILKSLATDAPVVIFDEPTAVLTPAEVEELFRVLRSLRDRGKVVVLIAHKLPEVLAVADRVTVLRRGRVVGSAPVTQVDEAQLADWMVGEMPPLGSRGRSESLGRGLRIRDLRVRGERGEEAVRGVSIEIARGEVVGIGGVDGNGQVELAEAIAGVRAPSAGAIEWEGGPLDWERIRTAYIPQDRQEEGLALPLSVVDNAMIEGHSRPELNWGPLLNSGAALEWVRGLMRRFDIRATDESVPVVGLSGGNQQKLVVARVLDRTPDLLVAVNPTRGLDIRATRTIHDCIRQAQVEGAAVALISTDLDELSALSDRVVFLSRGQIASGQGATALVGGEA